MSFRWRSLADILFRTAILLAAANLIFAACDPMPALGSVSLYNRVIPGRQRLPYALQPDPSFNLNLYNLDAMFASHEISAGLKPEGEFRVVLLGDSSVWGTLLRNEETRTALLNARGISADGMRLRFYNLGYPTISLFKDLLLLRRAMAYQPDMVIWSVTLESMPAEKQIFTPLVTNNADEARTLIHDFRLPYPAGDPAFVDRSFWDRTIFGRRRDLADLVWLQVKGFGWAATGVDVYIPDEYDRPENDLPGNTEYYGLAGPDFPPGALAWDVLDAGREMLGGIPLMLVNEPIFRADGANSNMRYNALYPRWAYNAYRELLESYVTARDIPCLDLWDAVPPDQFTNSSIHISAESERVVTGDIETAVRRMLSEAKVLP
jgi:hypothetical protein